MEPSAIKPIVMLLFFALVVGVPSLIGTIAVGVWLRRTHRVHALKTYMGAVLSALVAVLGALGAILLTVVIERRSGGSLGSIEHHPLPVFVVLALWALAACAVLACMLFSAWTIWRLVQAPPAQPLRTTPAS
jgi:hypothetical protein